MASTLPDELLTVRDVLRYAVSRFRAAELSYGHGTANALDEAAFMVLEGLHLPVDDINPWLEARLLRSEREWLADLIEARIETRKPAAYLLGKAYVRGIPFKVDERVIVPRSYIGELLLDGIGPGGLGLIEEADAVASVLDLCTGSGALAVIAAMAFPNAEVDAVDISGKALEVARTNVEMHGLGGQIELLQGDLFGPVAGRRYDLIVSNPPYVAEAEVEAFTPEYASEPRIAHLGGEDGLDLVRRILAEAGKHLHPGGGLICEIGTGQAILEAEFDLPFTWLDTAESEGEVFWLGAGDLGA